MSDVATICCRATQRYEHLSLVCCEQRRGGHNPCCTVPATHTSEHHLQSLLTAASSSPKDHSPSPCHLGRWAGREPSSNWRSLSEAGSLSSCYDLIESFPRKDDGACSSDPSPLAEKIAVFPSLSGLCQLYPFPHG